MSRVWFSTQESSNCERNFFFFIFSFLKLTATVEPFFPTPPDIITVKTSYILKEQQTTVTRAIRYLSSHLKMKSTWNDTNESRQILNESIPYLFQFNKKKKAKKKTKRRKEKKIIFTRHSYFTPLKKKKKEKNNRCRSNESGDLFVE